MTGILEQLFERRDAVLSLKNYQQWVDLGIIDSTPSGISVTPSNALQYSAVFACVRILADTVASIPLIMYERLERGKRRATNHPLYDLLKNRPNEVMTSFEFRESRQHDLGLWGNAYSVIELAGQSGRIQQLWPLSAGSMLQIRELDRRLYYLYQFASGEMHWFLDEEIWHLRGMGSDGRIGYSPIRLMREAIGLGKAAEEYGARFFSGDATAGIVLEHPGTLSVDAQKRIKSSWHEEHGGLEKKHRVMIAEEGMKVHEISIPPDDAQFLETRRFQLQEIARWYRIPPHMLADLTQATFSNIEHQSIEFVTQVARPWFVRWEQSIEHSLMLAEDRATYFPEFLVDALLRGDTASRYTAYAQARQNGWLSANDIRELENMNPIEGGDVYLVPLNMVPANSVSGGLSAGGTAATRALAAPGHEERSIRSVTFRRRLANSYTKAFEQVAARVIRREVNDLRGAMAKTLRRRGLPEFNLWLDSFYRDQAEFIRREMLPVYQTYAELVAAEAGDEVGSGVSAAELDAFVRKYIDTYVARHVATSTGQIQSIVGDPVNAGAGLEAALDQRFGEWLDTRPGKIASRESVASGNAVSKFVYGAAGFLALRWYATGKSCPYCSGLDGRVISIEANFLDEGKDYQPDGADSPMAPNSNISHPPVHDGCDCQIGPA